MTGVTAFHDFFVVEGREDGLDQVEVHGYRDGAVRRAFGDAAHAARISPRAARTRMRPFRLGRLACRGDVPD